MTELLRQCGGELNANSLGTFGRFRRSGLIDGGIGARFRCFHCEKDRGIVEVLALRCSRVHRFSRRFEVALVDPVEHFAPQCVAFFRHRVDWVHRFRCSDSRFV
jgi:hypothetical protein